MILAIDSSVGTSVAVIDGHRVLAETNELGTRSHAEVIGTLIRNALRDAGAAPADIRLVATGVGPGPFTGLRVGMAAAAAFAWGCGIPETGIVSHDAIAYRNLLAQAAARVAKGGEPPRLVVATDARRRQLFVSQYAGMSDQGIPLRIADPALASADVARAEGEWITPDHVSAGDLGLIAAARLARGLALLPTTPLYLRAPDVTQAKPKRVTQ